MSELQGAVSDRVMKDNKNLETESLLSEWKTKVTANKIVHYNASLKCWRWYYILGVFSIFLSALVGSVAFYNLDKQTDNFTKYILGFISIITATFSVIQLLFRYSDRATLHKQCSSKFASLEREIEILLTNLPKNKEELNRRIQNINREMFAISQQTPAIIIDNKVIAGGVGAFISPTK